MLLEKHWYNEPRPRKESKTLKGKSARSRCSHLKWRFSASRSLRVSCFPPPSRQSCPLSRSFSIFGRVRDIFESLTAIKTLIKWDGAPRCSRGTYPAEREKGSVRSRRVSEPGREEEKTSCGESILLRRMLREPTSSSVLFLSFSRSCIFLFFLFLSHSRSLRASMVPCSSQCLSTCLSCTSQTTFPRG